MGSLLLLAWFRAVFLAEQTRHRGRCSSSQRAIALWLGCTLCAHSKCQGKMDGDGKHRKRGSVAFCCFWYRWQKRTVNNYAQRTSWSINEIRKSASPANRYPSWKSHLPGFAWFCLVLPGFAWFLLHFASFCHVPVLPFLQPSILSPREGKRTKQQAARIPGFISHPLLPSLYSWVYHCFLFHPSSVFSNMSNIFFSKSPKLPGSKLCFYYAFIYNENRLPLRLLHIPALWAVLVRQEMHSK